MYTSDRESFSPCWGVEVIQAFFELVLALELLNRTFVIEKVLFWACCIPQTLGAKGNLTKFLGGENGGRSGHFHLQAAFQRLNTVCPVCLTGLSVETLPGSFATNSCDWRSPQLLGRHFPCTYKPANLAGSRQRTVRDSVRTLTAQRSSIQKAILQTTSSLKVKFNQTQEYCFRDAVQEIRYTRQVALTKARPCLHEFILLLKTRIKV